MNRAALDVAKYLYGRTWDILSTYSRVGIAGLYDCFITEFLRNFQTTFQRGCIGLLSHKANKRVSFPHTSELVVIYMLADAHSDCGKMEF